MARHFYLFHAAFEKKPVEVAQFSEFTQDDLLHDDTACEIIFGFTQNLCEDNWTKHCDELKDCKVTLKEDREFRSTSVGDMVLVKDGTSERLWVCEGIGWKKIKEN